MKRLLIFLGVVFLVAISLVGPIDRTPLREQDFYRQMNQSLDTLQLEPSPKGKLKVGWSSFGIIPNHTMPMAGYAPRDHFDSVHDSLYAKILSISNGFSISYFITIDLLIFPPRLKELIYDRMKPRANESVYLSASHTHNGLGGWNESLAGRYYAGTYDESWLVSLADSTMANIDKAKKSSLPARLGYWDVDASEYVANRLVSTGKVDGKLRGLKILRQDSSDAILFTYSAHPTNIDHLAKTLSGDYPNAVNKRLQKKAVDFSMFMAGMVGSHRLDHIDKPDFELVAEAAEKLTDKILVAPQKLINDSLSITSSSITLTYSPSQLRIAKDWKIRDWLFSIAFGKLKPTVTYLRMGDILFIGTPCDFSGELAVNQKLHELAKAQGLNLIITSFNGNYTGYITDDSHYDEVEAEEVRVMNWVGPYYGTYYAEIVKLLIKK